MDKKVLRNLSYGVYVVTSKDNDRNVGCVANSVMQVTSNPMMVAVSINHDNYTNSCVKKSGKFVVSILKEDSDAKIIGEFGFKSSRDTDKFKNINYNMVDDLAVINDSCGYLICEVIDQMETNTHTVFLAEITNADGYTDDNPMTYKYYHEKLKGTSPKNAPTYQEESKTEDVSEKKAQRWRCKICGYIYEGEELPSDFICPICGRPASEFERID